MDYLKDFYEICEVLSRELADANNKVRTSGGKLSGSDLDYIDKLTHAIKSIKTTIAMMEADGGESGYNMPHYGAYRNYTNDGSYARKRDSMGRYSRRYSGHDMIPELRDLMESAQDDRTRMEFQTFIDKLERM